MMNAIADFLSRLHSEDGLQSLLASAGPYVIVLLAAIVFAEKGLLIGFFLPGDSLLLVAGVMAAKGAFDPAVGVAAVTLAAILGDQVGFLLGRRAGKAVLSRGDGRLIKRRHFVEAHEYFEKHGARSIVVARFIPVLRTFVPFVAGVAEMPGRTFLIWNVIGGCLWVWSLLGLGYSLGSSPWVKHLHHIVLAVVVASVLPVVIGAAVRLWKRRNRPASE